MKESAKRDLSALSGRANSLAELQIQRRQFMLGLLATGGAAALASLPDWQMAAAQTPAASSGGTGVGGASQPFDGTLAAEQVMTLPTAEPTTMDPAVSSGGDELDLIVNMYDGLVGIDQQTGAVVPLVAESYEFNEDASVFTFHIRPNAVWSDGTPLNANDFLYSWQRVLDPETASQYIPALYPIKGAQAIAEEGADISTLGVKVVDDATLEVTLEGPTPFFPLLATTWTYCPVPKHVIDEKGLDWVEPGNVVSNGPYIMTSWEHDQEMTVEQNPNYYLDKPTITKATYRIFSDYQAQSFTAYEAGELDYAYPQGADLERALADAELAKQILTFERSNNYFVVCDTTNAPTDNVDFRQALYLAIDRDTLANDVFKGQYLPAPTMLPPDIPGNNPGAALTGDAAAALTASGVDAASTEIEFTFVNLDFNKTVAEYLQAQWQDNLGIKVKMAPIEDAAYTDWRASRETAPFGVYTGSWGSDFSDASNWFNQNFTAAADHYRNHWNYPDFDNLVGAAAVNTNAEERNQQYSDAEVMLIEQAPVIPVLRGIAFRSVKPQVRDLFLQAVLNYVHLRTVKIQEA